ncbi:MAG: hypothetical protein IJV35_00410 [Neisseriaceae bacterium]|nr:hypothetical protein [Neisseriaceae bacterium]
MRPFAYALGDIFVSDKSLTNIVVLDNASILLLMLLHSPHFVSGSLKNN